MTAMSESRKHAKQCRELASTVAPEIRAELLTTADMWDRLAVDQEVQSGKETIRAYIEKWHRRAILQCDRDK
jgi:hypothetical protein